MCSEFFSKYKIISKLGEGTFSDVLKCKNLKTGELVAVKKLKKQYKELSEVNCLPELIVMLKLSYHTNVLTLLEFMFDHTEGKLYMVFELMEMSLYDLIQAHTRCLPESRVRHMFYQLLKGVDHLHSHGILHRDIKPENVLVTKSLVKLADLGSVRGIHSKPPYTDYISTRWYRAPECMLSAGFYSSKVDVWACGCVFYEMLTSKPIFPGANDIDQLTKIHQFTGTPNSRLIMKMRRCESRVSGVKFTTFQSTNLVALLPFTSDGGREVLKRMLVYDPDARTNVRRLLEHRYFNDLRKIESVKHSVSSHSNNLPLILSNSKMVMSNKSCNTFQPVKVMSKDIDKVHKKESERKLSTKSWGPATNTSNNLLTTNMTKVINKTISNTKQKYCPSSRTQIPKKTPPDKLKINRSLREIKMTNVGGTRRILPTIIPKHIQESRSQVSEFCMKSLSNDVLPPILEL